MPKFRVFGRKYEDYWIEVEAKDEFHAAEVANKKDSNKWNRLSNDDTIEAVDVYLNEDISMAAGIIVGGE